MEKLIALAGAVPDMISDAAAVIDESSGENIFHLSTDAVGLTTDAITDIIPGKWDNLVADPIAYTLQGVGAVDDAVSTFSKSYSDLYHYFFHLPEPQATRSTLSTRSTVNSENLTITLEPSIFKFLSTLPAKNPKNQILIFDSRYSGTK